MSLLKRLLGTTLKASQTRAVIDEEVRFHLDRRSEELERRGASPGEAARLARRQFGGVALASERARDADTFAWLDGFLKDLGHVAEGVPCAAAALALAHQYRVELPIVEAVQAVLDGRRAPADAVRELLSREPRDERDEG